MDKQEKEEESQGIHQDRQPQIRLIAAAWLFCLVLGGIGCGKKPQPLPPSIYDPYIIDLPHFRGDYGERRVKTRRMMEIKMLDLPAEGGGIARRDSFDRQGLLLATRFFNEAFADSIRYLYSPSSRISETINYGITEQPSSNKYIYGALGQMTQMIAERQKMTAYDIRHDRAGRLEHKVVAAESPTPSKTRDHYKYDTQGRLAEQITYIRNVPRSRVHWVYDKGDRLIRKDFLQDGTVVSSHHFIYDDSGLLSLLKERNLNDSGNFTQRVFEFLYEYYDETP